MFHQIHAGICYFCFCLLTVVCCLEGGAAIISQDCEAVNVSGAVRTKEINGVYLLDQDFKCNERQVWLQTSGEHYLYYLLDGFNGWVIGLNSCFRWGDFIAIVKTNSEKPFQVTETWQEFDPTVDEFENRKIFVQCTVDNENLNSEKDNCENNPCTNGGTCLGAENGYTCVCRHGFFGHRCQTPITIDYCKQSQCKNGGECISLLTDFECRCLEGFTGRICGVALDENEDERNEMPHPFYHGVRSKWKKIILIFSLIISGFFILAIAAAICLCQRQPRHRLAENITDDSITSFRYKQLKETTNRTIYSESDDHRVTMIT